MAHTLPCFYGEDKPKHSIRLQPFAQAWSRNVFLGFMLVVMVMLGVVGNMMMMRGGKGRAGKHHQQQGSSKNLLHGENLARRPRQEKQIDRPGIKTGTGAPRRPGLPKPA
jgi:hypothetical protein